MKYPVLLLRIKAMMIDSIILCLLFFSMLLLTMKLGITDPTAKVCFLFIPVILFEPLMIWITGGSCGHHYSGIRVIGKRSGKNLFILNGIVRYLAKTFLGLISITLMFLTKRHQTMHDFLSHSVVVFKDESAAPDNHKLSHREAVYSQKPSIIRRIIVIVLYLIISFFILGISLNLLLPTHCIEYGQCNEIETLKIGISSLVFLVVALIVIILGFLSKLPGAYYRATRDSYE